MLNAVTLALFKATIALVVLHFAASAVARLLTWVDDGEGVLLRNVMGGKLRWVTAPLFMDQNKTPKRWLYPWYAIELTSKKGWNQRGGYDIRDGEDYVFAGHAWSLLLYGIAIGATWLLTILTGEAIAYLLTIAALLVVVFLARNYIRCRKTVAKSAEQKAE